MPLYRRIALCALDTRTSPRIRPTGTPHGVDSLARPCVPSPVSSIRTPKLPLLPQGEKGVGRMRGMGARASPPASPRPGYAGVSLVCAFPPVNQATLRCIIKQPEDNIACRITVLRLTPAGFRRQGKRRSHRGRFFGNPLRAISRFRHQNVQNPPSPLVGEGGWGDEGQRRTGMQNIAYLSQKLYT